MCCVVLYCIVCCVVLRYIVLCMCCVVSCRVVSCHAVLSPVLNVVSFCAALSPRAIHYSFGQRAPSNVSGACFLE